jgi:hypothetical protein
MSDLDDLFVRSNDRRPWDQIGKDISVEDVSWFVARRMKVGEGESKGSVDSSVTIWRLSKVVLLSWVSMLGVDFFLHAGLLARLYLEPSPFLLAPIEAFRLIPIGYLSFLLVAILLLWLTVRVDVDTWRKGLVLGFKLGVLVGGSMTLGLLSISTADPILLLGWFVGQLLELTLAGAVAGSGLASTNLTRLSLKVTTLVFVLFILTVALQAVGLAPAASL